MGAVSDSRSAMPRLEPSPQTVPRAAGGPGQVAKERTVIDAPPKPNKLAKRCEFLIQTMLRLGKPEAAYRWKIAERCSRSPRILCDPNCPFNGNSTQNSPLECTLLTD